MGRVTGIALIALGLACWPNSVAAQAFWGLLTYNSLAMLYLAYLGIKGEWAGSLLWPAVVIHAMFMFLLTRAWFGDRRACD